MIYTWQKCIEIYGSDYQIKKQINAGTLFQVEKGIYSDQETFSDIEVIKAKYPRAIFTGESAYYYHGLTDVIPRSYCLATKREDSRIHDKTIKQRFVEDALYDFGKTWLDYQGAKVPIYSKERLLVDLIRFRTKIPFDYYKEVIVNYRRLIDELDLFEAEDYAMMFTNYEKIMDTIQLEVL